MSENTDARRRHYGEFYGLSEPEEHGRVVLVVGNCQAESLRIMMQGPDVTPIRMPPVHELTVADLPHLDRWLGRASVLISQPIRDNYHGMPLGTAQLATRLGRGDLVTVPVIRFAGLYPRHAIIRPPRDPSMTPPVVEYHDLGTLAEAAGAAVPELTVSAVHAIGELSLSELRRREQAWDSVPASDLFTSPSFSAMRTLNHPGNPIWAAMAGRVRDRLGLAAVEHDPGRPLLNAVHAPRDATVIEAWGLSEVPVEDWRVGDEVVTAAEVREAHLEWYAMNPDVVEAGMRRHETSLRLLAGH
ncbi:peptide ABC transporter ATPase [Microbacteriaceae bacterium VKM Ac-2855]|nr:peptide ABC transporter ATPase [Microbacteriaceae bacterium VKM Ac-2855]